MPVLDKPHRIVYLRRGGRDGYTFEIALTAASNTGRVEIGVTAEELAAISASYEVMKYQRDIATVVRDPNVYADEKGGAS